MPVFIREFAVEEKAPYWDRANWARPICRDLRVVVPFQLRGRDVDDQEDLARHDIATPWEAFGSALPFPAVDWGVDATGDFVSPPGPDGYFRWTAGDPVPVAWNPGAEATILVYGYLYVVTTNTTRALVGFNNNALTKVARLYLEDVAGVDRIRVEEEVGGTSRIVDFFSGAAYPATGSLLPLIVRTDTDRLEVTLGDDTEVASSPTALTPDAAAFDQGTIAAHWDGTTLTDQNGIDELSFYAAWDRWLSDDEVRELVADPFLPCRPLSLLERTGRLLLAHKELPCPGFPVATLEDRPLDHTRPDGGSPVMAAKPDGRRVGKTYELTLSELTDVELAPLLKAWDGGRGQAAPFDFAVPGTSTTERVVFLDGFALTHRSSLATDAKVRLRSVTPPDFSAFSSGALGAYNRDYDHSFDIV